MTINKSQGQTLGSCGVYLPSPVFSHGVDLCSCCRPLYACRLPFVFLPFGDDVFALRSLRAIVCGTVPGGPVRESSRPRPAPRRGDGGGIRKVKPWCVHQERRV